MLAGWGPPDLSDPSPGADGGPHRLAHRGGEVKALGTMEWEKATEGMPLGAGDSVRTDPRSGARIEFLDGTFLDVRPESLLTIEGIADLRLDSGQGIVRSRQKNLERPPEVSRLRASGRTRRRRASLRPCPSR